VSLNASLPAEAAYASAASDAYFANLCMVFIREFMFYMRLFFIRDFLGDFLFYTRIYVWQFAYYANLCVVILQVSLNASLPAEAAYASAASEPYLTRPSI